MVSLLAAGGCQLEDTRAPERALPLSRGSVGLVWARQVYWNAPWFSRSLRPSSRPSCRLKIGTCFRNLGPWGLESNAGSTMEEQVLCPGGSRLKMPLVSLHLSISIIDWDWPCWEPITPVTHVSPRTCSWSAGGWPRGWREPMVINSPETQDVCLLTLSGEIR